MTYLIRDLVERPTRAYCHHRGCGWEQIHLHGPKIASLAEAHTALTGHIVSVVAGTETVLRRSPLQPVDMPSPDMPIGRSWPARLRRVLRGR